MQTDRKDYLVQLTSDVSAVIILEPAEDGLLQKTPSESFRVTLQLAIHI